MANIRMIKIPTPYTAPLEEVTIERGWPDLYRLMDGYVERVSLAHWAQKMKLQWRPILVVDEEGLFKQLNYNPRATRLYHGGTLDLHGPIIAGDAYLLAEDYVEDEDGLAELDFVSVPDSFKLEELTQYLKMTHDHG